MSKVHSQFQSTCWTHFHQLSSGDVQLATRAMNEICKTYWQPLYQFALGVGCRKEDAEDCVQGFLSTVTSNQFFTIADPNKGRVRSYLLVSFKRYIYDVWKKQNAQKRGGNATIVSLEENDPHDHSDDHSDDPSLAYDQHWAMTVVDSAKENLRQRYIAQGKAELHAALLDCIDGTPLKDFAGVAQSLSMSDSALKAAVHRIRKRFGEEVRLAVAETVANENEIDSELAWLIEVLSK